MSTTNYEQQWQGTRTPSGDRQEQTIADPRSPISGTPGWDQVGPSTSQHTHTHTKVRLHSLNTPWPGRKKDFHGTCVFSVTH